MLDNTMYIGAGILIARKSRHFWLLRNNKHWNHGLQESYNKDQDKNLKFKILLYCESFECKRYEQFFIDKYRDSKLLYNIYLDDVGSPLGLRASDETKKLLSKNHTDMKGKNNPMWGKRGKDSPNFNKRSSKVTIKKLRIVKSIKKETVLKILKMLNNNVSVKNICRYLDISVTPVYNTKNGKYNDIYNLSDQNLVFFHGHLIKKNVVLQAINMLKDDISARKVAENLNIGVATVYRIKNGRYDNVYNLESH